MAQILDKQGLQHYANKMCNADNRKVGSKNLPTALNEIDIAIDGFKTLFETEYGTPVNMELENNENVFSIGTGINIDKKDDVENSFTDVELSGNSLVNITHPLYPMHIKWTHEGTWKSKFILCADAPNINADSAHKKVMFNPRDKTTYTIVCNVIKNTSSANVALHNAENTICMFKTHMHIKPSDVGILKFVQTADYNGLDMSRKDLVVLRTQSSGVASGEIEIADIMILEGDWSNKPLPQYFQGLKSIGEKEDGNHKISISSVGNNLIDFKNPIKNVLSYSMGFPFELTKTLSSLGSKYKLLDNGFYFESPNNSHNQGVGFYVKCKKNTNYILSCMVDFKNAPAIKCQGVYSNEIPINNHINRALLISKEKISTSDFSVTFNSQNYDYLLFYFGGSWLSQMPGSVDMKFTNIQLEEISKTPYQPYKEDEKEILLNEPLRGLPNGVKDTIEKINGEWKIVRRCEEMILNGSETWGRSANSDLKELTSHFSATNFKSSSSTIICDKYKCVNIPLVDCEEEAVKVSGEFWVNINKSRLSTDTVEGFKEWLSQNNIRVIYKLETPIIEDVSPVTLQCWKNGTISIDEVLPVETTHTVALNKSAQIQKNIEELTLLRNRVEALEKQYNNSTLNQAYELELLRFDMQLDNII